MRITNPDTLWLYIILIPVVILMLLFYGVGISDLQKLTGTWRFVAVKRVFRVRFLVSSLLFVLCLFFMLVALSGFSWQKKPEKDDSQGLEILFVLDVSRSMNAEDIVPSRLAKSVSLISTIIDNVDSGKMGIIAFKGEAIVAVPITEDRLIINSFLGAVNSNIITSPGSNQEKAVSLALDSFSGNSVAKRVVLFITDGESLEGDVFRNVSKSINSDIPIYTVAAGTHKGATIPDGNGGDIKNLAGKSVISRVDYGVLEDLSELTYGNSYRLEEATVIAEVIQDIRSLTSYQGGERIKYINIVQYRIFLIISLLFLLLYLFFKEWRWSEIL